jgi:hypothetical protein
MQVQTIGDVKVKEREKAREFVDRNATDPQSGTNADRTFALRMKENFHGRADGDRLRL